MKLSIQSLPNYHRRKIINMGICAVLLLSTVLALIPLFNVFGYVLWRGVAGLSWSFFTELPKPVGDVGGGMANALVGTLTLVGIGSALGIFLGMSTGVYLSEYGKGKLGNLVRLSMDVL